MKKSYINAKIEAVKHLHAVLLLIPEQRRRSIWPQGYKTFFVLNSTEHEIFPAHKCCILTFMSGKNSILDLSEPKKAEFLDIFLFRCIYNFMLN